MEIGAVGRVCHNTCRQRGRGGEHHGIGVFLVEKAAYGHGVEQVELGSVCARLGLVNPRFTPRFAITAEPTEATVAAAAMYIFESLSSIGGFSLVL